VNVGDANDASLGTTLIGQNESDTVDSSIFCWVKPTQLNPKLSSAMISLVIPATPLAGIIGGWCTLCYEDEVNGIDFLIQIIQTSAQKI
jgi:hypothetical protein